LFQKNARKPKEKWLFSDTFGYFMVKTAPVKIDHFWLFCPK